MAKKPTDAKRPSPQKSATKTTLRTGPRPARNSAPISKRAAPPSRTTPAEWIAEQDAAMQPLLKAARALCRKAAPHAEERVYDGWNLLAFKNPRLCCGVYPFRGAVKIAFEGGAELDDPQGLLQSTKGGMRFVLINSEDQLTAAVADLVRQACGRRHGK